MGQIFLFFERNTLIAGHIPKLIIIYILYHRCYVYNEVIVWQV